MTIPVAILNRPDQIDITTPASVLDCLENGAVEVVVSFTDDSLGDASHTVNHTSSTYQLDISSPDGLLELIKDKVNLESASFDYSDYKKIGGSHVVVTGELYELNTFVYSFSICAKRSAWCSAVNASINSVKSPSIM